ncbi:helix-turn-helix transcriptional regulator [Nocardia sp. BSTN01]|uniref:winged helix-turn-helix transcriptional regulator n=1 Tax=Nocardia sp. BSTN01 TaxID=2783665 RepID=UPI00188E7D0C|nr:helix-turn-helix domain-containing protein [Nocardia sp. BSTN01]MBF5000383.1 helix-turn-helix transcriptional regulator [Nocardia sp. BSTN01]
MSELHDELRRLQHDPVAAAVEHVGDRWTFLILREIFFGVRRFADMRRNLGVARNVLTERLKKLVDNGILKRRRYSERPPRDEYRLTEKGRDLYGITVALMQWGNRWGPEGPTLRLLHADDDGELEQVIRCTCCGRDIHAREVRYEYTTCTDE